MKKTILASLLLFGCVGEPGQKPKTALFVGVDVSGSFYRADYQNSIEFLSHYLYGHLNKLGNLSPLRELYVAAIGGDTEEDPKSFHPIQDFQGKSIPQIQADLKKWFPKGEHITDFNIFFKQVANIAQKRKLSLAPITVILLSDGIPAIPGKGGKAEVGNYEKIDFSPLEYLSRNVTIRLLYASPQAASKWENSIPRKRVRIWTVDNEVMVGWKAQLDSQAGIENQEKIWKWVLDRVDYLVPSISFRSSSIKK
ncbi:MAG: hypothetical protein HY400_01555 [Elusimicrobia bacterium]|nr:hypothetical protein [Elusimicrobiota bacterium]